MGRREEGGEPKSAPELVCATGVACVSASAYDVLVRTIAPARAARVRALLIARLVREIENTIWSSSKKRWLGSSFLAWRGMTLVTAHFLSPAEAGMAKNDAVAGVRGSV